MDNLRMRISRRSFVQSIAGGLVAARLPYRDGERLPIAFSTLACPAWGWAKILDFAATHGFAAIELRGLQGNLDLPSHPVFSKPRIEQAKREIAARGLRIACVSSSAHMDEADATKRVAQLSDAKRCIELAAALESPYIRVFGTNGETRATAGDAVRAQIASGLGELGECAASHSVTVLIESHDNCVTSPILADIFRRAESTHVALLWDAHHTYAEGHEDPDFTVEQLGKWIRHTHLKDSFSSGGERKYVLTGRGDIPIQAQVRALQKIGYAGFYCFEWEKVWHPDLTDPEIAIADFARVMSAYLHSAR